MGTLIKEQPPTKEPADTIPVFPKLLDILMNKPDQAKVIFALMGDEVSSEDKVEYLKEK